MSKGKDRQPTREGEAGTSSSLVGMSRGSASAIDKLTEIALKSRGDTRTERLASETDTADALAQFKGDIHRFTAVRRIEDPKIYLWRQGTGQRADILNTALGIDAGLDTILRQQAELPMFNEMQVGDEDVEVNPIWSTMGPLLSHHSFASAVVNGMMPGWRTRKGSAVCNIETADAAARNGLSTVWPTAPDEVQKYAVSMVTLFGTTLGLILDPESETATTEERGRSEPVTLAELDTALMYSATARAAFAALSGAIPETDDFVTKEIVANALQIMIDAFVRSRPTYINYMAAIRRHLGALRLALTCGLELDFADTSNAYRAMSSNWTFLRVAQRTKNLPMPSLKLTQRWIRDAVLVDEALSAIEEELILVSADHYVTSFNVARSPRDDFSYFAAGPAGSTDSWQAVKVYPRGGSSVLNIKSDNILQEGIDEIQRPLLKFADFADARVHAESFDDSFVARPGATEVCALGVESQVLMSLCMQPHFTVVHAVSGGLRKVRPDYGVSETALALYMQRDIMFAPSVAKLQPGMPQSVFSHAIGAEVSVDNTTTCSPWAVMRMAKSNSGQELCDPERHLGRMLSQTKRDTLVAYSGSAVARARLEPYKKFAFKLAISHPDRLIFPKRTISLVRFLVGSALYYEDESVYIIGPHRRTASTWLAGHMRMVDVWDAIAIGHRDTMWQRAFTAPLRDMLRNGDMGHQTSELIRKLSPHATRYGASRSHAASLTLGARATAYSVGLNMLGFDDLAVELYSVLTIPALQREPEVLASAMPD